MPLTQQDIDNEVLRSELPAYLQLFEFNFNTANISGLSGYFRVSPSQSPAPTQLFGGDAFTFNFPIDIQGIEQTSGEAPARPQLTVSNVDKYFGTLCFAFQDLVGTEVIYYRTFAPYLNQSTRLALQPLKYVIAKKLDQIKNIITFELRDPSDKDRSYMPRRQMLKKDFPGLGVNKSV